MAKSQSGEHFLYFHASEYYELVTIQREAYLEPAVDASGEKFQWGLPDLDGLRQYAGYMLSFFVLKTN